MGKLKRQFKKERREAVKRLKSSPVQGTGFSSPPGAQSTQAAARVRSQPVISSTPILYCDLTDQIPTENELNALVASFKKRPTFRMLCMLNTLLSFYAHDIPNAIRVQQFLFANLIDDDLFERAKQRFARNSMAERPIFHRQQLLAMMKKVLLESAENGEVDPNPNENLQARYKLGRACLMMNDFLFPEEQEERLKTDGSLADNERIHGELFAQWLPTSELLNPPDVKHSIVRNLEYVNIFDRSFNELVFSDGQSLSQRFTQLTGLELKRYLVLIFNFYLFYRDQSRSFKKLIKYPGRFNVDKRVIFAKMKLTGEEVEAFFELTATDIDSLIQAFQTVNATKHPVLAQYDFTPFRTYPLVYVNDEKHVVTCVDPSFLAEKISTGAYHTILRSLEVEESVRTKADESDRKRFLKRYWGEVFQIYVNDRLREVFPPESNRFYDSPKWDSPKAKSNEEAFDSVLDCGDALIIMEDKGKYLELSAKYSGRREALLADLHGRFGKGVQQLADSIEIVFNNDPKQKRHPFSERNKENQSVRQFTLEDIERVKKIYPVLIVQDFSLRIGFANRELRNLFEQEIKTRKIDHELVQPLSLLTIEDLENLIPYLSEVSFTDILDEYIRPHEPLYTFKYILDAYVKRKGIERSENDWIEERFEELRRSLTDLFAVID